MSYLMDQRRLLFWKRTMTSDNIVLRTLGRFIRGRMHHFVLKFSKLFRFRRQQGIDLPNQNPADAVAVTAEHCESAAVEVHDHRPMVDLTNV